MNIISINGRTIIPLRAVPAATGYWFDSNDLPAFLIDPEAHYPTRLPEYFEATVPVPLAHYISDDGRIVALQPSQHLGWTTRYQGPVHDAEKKLPEDIFLWSDELIAYLEGLKAELHATARLDYKPMPTDSLTWSQTPLYLSATEASDIEESNKTLQQRIKMLESSSISGRCKKYVRTGDNGVDPVLQAEAAAIANEWKADGKKGRECSKRTVCEEIASRKKLDVATVERVTRKTW